MRSCSLPESTQGKNLVLTQLSRAWHIAAKDMRTYYLKPPLISWGILFPLVMILAFYLRDPSDIRTVAPGLIAMTLSNAARFPMVFLCGVFVPLTAMAPALRAVASLLPLTYTVDALRHLLLEGGGAFFPLWVDLLASVGFGILLYLASLRLTSHRLEDLL